MFVYSHLIFFHFFCVLPRLFSTKVIIFVRQIMSCCNVRQCACLTTASVETFFPFFYFYFYHREFWFYFSSNLNCTNLPRGLSKANYELKLKTQKYSRIFTHIQCYQFDRSSVLNSRHLGIAVILNLLFLIFSRVHWNSHFFLKKMHAFKHNRNSQNSSKILYISRLMFCVNPSATFTKRTSKLMWRNSRN